MIKPKKDLIGKVFGRLTVLEQIEDYVSPGGRHIARYLCECSCGDHNKVKVTRQDLTSGHTQSCGCLQRERTSVANKKYNTYNLIGDFGIGYCYNTGSEFYFDLEDYDLIKDYCWTESIGKYGYRTIVAYDSKNKQMIKMHYLFGYKGYDHIDRNALNNRRNNLRRATASENAQNSSLSIRNSSGIIGISWSKEREKWLAQIHSDGITVNLGRFIDKEDAIKARLLAEAKYFGEFAPQRHLFEQYGITIQNELKEVV